MTAAPLTPHITLTIDGRPFDRLVRVEVSRSLTDLAGAWRVEVRDHERGAAITAAGQARAAYTLGAGGAAELAVDGTPLLRGWVEAVHTRVAGDAFAVDVAGRDRAGDLVDGAAAPDGPLEYRRLTVLDIARRIAAPYGLGVRAVGDVGAPFARYAIEPEATALEAIERAARARALLVLSDGVGGLVLTRGGSEPGPAPLELGGNLLAVAVTEDWSQRFGTYIVKGQAEKAGKLDTTAHGLDEPPAPEGEAAGTAIAGRATDRAITRHRPTVLPARTECSTVSVAAQATWALRAARGRSLRVEAVVRGWGVAGQMWRPNQLVRVIDRTFPLDQDLLVEALTLSQGPDGSLARLTLVGPDAYDLLPEDAPRGGRQGAAGRLDTTAEGL